MSSCITPLNIKNSSTGHDRHCISSFGEYTIHFLTPEHPLQSLPGEYFYDKAILSIDLEEVFNVDIKEQDAFLRDTVLLLNEYKKWHIPHKSLNVYQEEILSQEEAEKEIQRFEEEEKKRLELEERWKQNQEIRMKNLKRQLLESKEKEDKSNYIIARSLEISSEEFSKFDKKDLDSLKRMKNFFNWMVEDKEYYIPKGSSFALMKKGNNLWGYWAYDQIYCVVLLHSTYYMYQYKNGKFLFIKRAYGIFSLEEYLKEMVQTKQEADSLF